MNLEISGLNGYVMIFFMDLLISVGRETRRQGSWSAFERDWDHLQLWQRGLLSKLLYSPSDKPIALERGASCNSSNHLPFIVDLHLPIKNGDFPHVNVYQAGYQLDKFCIIFRCVSLVCQTI